MRRSWLLVVLVFILSALAGAGAGAAQAVTFTHGVASGDVTSSRAIVWTRVDSAATLTVKVFLGTPPCAGSAVFSKTVQTSAADDFTAKVDARGLKAGTTHCYRWSSPGATSPPDGTFKTAPDPKVAANVRFTYTADSDGTTSAVSLFPQNFAVLDRARLEPSDFFVYLGDTIYSDSLLRGFPPDPPGPGPATAVADYREAYKINRGITALPNLLKATSTVPQWDDHEVCNDFAGQLVDCASGPDGAPRYAAGREAFLEYMPIRETISRDLLSDPTCAAPPLFRKFRWGSLVEVIVPDLRSCRSFQVGGLPGTPPAAGPCGSDLAPTAPAPLRAALFAAGFLASVAPPPGCLEAIFDPSRTMLGPAQKQALKTALANSKAKFKFVMSEVPMQQFFALPYDRWEGYGAERNEILNFIKIKKIPKVVFLSTDMHANLVNQVFIDFFFAPTTIATELVTGPIATFTFEQEVLAAFGAGGLAAFNSVLSLIGVDCRDLNKISYGVVDVTTAGGGTATVTLKDSTGATVLDQPPSPTAGVSCTKTF